jgi:hypothetical protein
VPDVKRMCSKAPSDNGDADAEGEIDPDVMEHQMLIDLGKFHKYIFL